MGITEFFYAVILLNGGNRVSITLFSARFEDFNTLFFSENAGAILIVLRTAPRLNAKERRVLKLPDTKSREVGEINAHALVVLVEQRNGARNRVFHIENVVVEHLVVKLQNGIVFDKHTAVIRLIYARNLVVIWDIRGFLFGENKSIIREIAGRGERGVTAYAVRHFLAAVIFNALNNCNSVLAKLLFNRELEVEREHSFCRFVLNKRKNSEILADFFCGKFKISRKTVL